MFKARSHPHVSYDMKSVVCFLKTSCCKNIGHSVQFWNIHRLQSYILSICGGNCSWKPKPEVSSKQNLLDFITIIMTVYSSEVSILGREIQGLWF